MNKEQADKRNGQRIHTALPIYLRNAGGITRDVSALGVYLWASECACAPGEVISFSVELKRPEGTRILKCVGRVVRTEPREIDMGVAVRIVESALEVV